MGGGTERRDPGRGTARRRGEDVPEVLGCRHGYAVQVEEASKPESDGDEDSSCQGCLSPGSGEIGGTTKLLWA